MNGTTPYGKVFMPVCKDDTTGVMYDFNYGLQVATPDDEFVYHVTIKNADTGDVLYSQLLNGKSMIATDIKYYIRWELTVECKKGSFTHTLDLKQKRVAFRMSHKTLGDCIAYMSQIPKFISKHKCKGIVYAQQWCIDLFKGEYPDIEFRTLENLENDSYATYFIGLVFDDLGCNAIHDWNKVHYSKCGLQYVAANILGLPCCSEQPPYVNLVREFKKPTEKPYVAISVMGSKACKFWNNPTGWDEVVAYLQGIGYDVVAIDRYHVCGVPGSFYHTPNGVIDDTGDKPLKERIDTIRGADFFIGLGSGLSWLAWCCHVPVVMLSGFSRPEAEFYTPYRVFNAEAPCVDCWQDAKIMFNHHSFKWCPRIDSQIDEISRQLLDAKTNDEKSALYARKENLEMQRFACTSQITGTRVINTIKRLMLENSIQMPR